MLSGLRLQHFRSYADVSFAFDQGVNIIVGPNASGKTNLLEAVLVVARGSSYRAKDPELISFSTPWARLDATMQDGSQRIVKLVAEPASKSYDIDGKPSKRLPLTASLPIVLFEPNHLSLLSGSPDGRRIYLDDLLEQTVVGYHRVRTHYVRSLRQRNALLKRGGPNLSQQLFPWNVRLSELAGTIVRSRQALVEQLDAQIGELYQRLSGSDVAVRLHYQSLFKPEHYETHLLQRLEANQDIDLARGFTGAGPHREDLAVSFNDRSAVDTASRGETRTVVLALKILELERLRAIRDQAPLLLLDDVFSELDAARRRALTSYLQDYQTFITTTDADVVIQNFTQTCRVVALDTATTS